MENELYALQNRFVVELFNVAIFSKDITVLEEDDIVRTVNDYLKSARVNILSCDDVFGRSSGNLFVHSLELSRVVHSFSNRTFGISERPSFSSPDLQFTNIKSVIMSRGENVECVIYDLGIYGGRFITNVVESALAFGFKINKIVTCVTRLRGMDRIKKRFSELNIEFETLKVEFEEGWDELRDIIGLHGFLVDPNTLNISESTTDYAFIPYEEIISWFSLPIKSASKFREVCKSYKDELNGLFAREGLMVTIDTIGRHEDVFVYALRRLQLNTTIKRLNPENCSVAEFATFLDMVSDGKGVEALTRLRMSETINDFSERGELPSCLDRRLLMYLGIFKGDKMVAVGAVKYYPKCVKIWIKEESGLIIPTGISELGLINTGDLLIGKDALHLVNLPEYFELGNTAILPEERGKGLHTLLHRERIAILKQWRESYGSKVPSNLLITATGVLGDQLAVFNEGLDFNTVKMVLRDQISNEIWFRLGAVREVSSASAHLAMKLGLEEVGFAKSSGGPVFWTNNLSEISI
ncbi:hypothetical protein EXS45_00455 [Candidatus Nomurabacteria bacterium]|nr:hypothetical protein [Candidatus Nomurabacteria bacterium]